MDFDEGDFSGEEVAVSKTMTDLHRLVCILEEVIIHQDHWAGFKHFTNPLWMHFLENKNESRKVTETRTQAISMLTEVLTISLGLHSDVVTERGVRPQRFLTLARAMELSERLLRGGLD